MQTWSSNDFNDNERDSKEKYDSHVLDYLIELVSIKTDETIKIELK